MCPERTTSRKAEVPGLVFVVWQNEQTMYEAVRRVKLVKERFSPTSERLLSLFPSRSPEDRQVGCNLKRFMGLYREMFATCAPHQHVEFEVEESLQEGKEGMKSDEEDREESESEDGEEAQEAEKSEETC